MTTAWDPAVLYPDIAAHGSLAAALRAAAGGRLDGVRLTTPKYAPLRGVKVHCPLPHRRPLGVDAAHRERKWTIRGGDGFEDMTLLDGATDDLEEVAEAALAWHDGAALKDIRRVAPFVHLTGRFEVPDLDPASMAESAWQHLLTEARELESAWQPAYQALVQAAHAEPALRRLYPFAGHGILRFSTRTRPGLAPVGASLVVGDGDRYAVTEDFPFPNEDDPVFSTAAQAVAAAVRRLPTDLGPVALGCRP
ncbi:DUF6193 family natural product biosynthesis protein [Streptomyces sp. NPDC004311]|uniref:DUF6193 family natural product biosynthesis protein n=1 Tax=Streptomyces sp. NPDC004311 TaxID=3364698 RepID=UPI0036A3F621